MLDVLGVAVTSCVGVGMVHLQSGFIVFVLSVCISDEPSVCCMCVWSHLIEVCLFVSDKAHRSK